VDRAWSAAGGLLHEAARGGLASLCSGSGTPRKEAVDAARLSIRDRGAPAAGVWLDAGQGRDDLGNRAVDRGLRRIGPGAEQAPDPAPRDPRASAQGLWPQRERCCRGGEVSQRHSGDIQVFSPVEVRALVRAAASEQDGAILLTAAFTGPRMGELLALRWRDVDFAGRTSGSEPAITAAS
jgi:integrase